MAFVNFSLIFGGLFVAIPIVLHLVMRQQPKQLLFPALRFLKSRRDANRRQLQLRHWILLLLRCLAVGLMAFALARPSVPSLVLGNWLIIGALGLALLLTGLLGILAWLQRRSRIVYGGFLIATAVLGTALTAMLVVTLRKADQTRLGNREAPVGAVLLFDTSPRMQYLWQNKTRLDEARAIALWLLGQLPAESEIAVLDSRPGAAVFAVDAAAAQRTIERLEITHVPAPLPTTLDEALRLAGTSSRGRKEVYVFTDLTRPTWQAESYTALQRRLTEARDVALHVIDIGCEQPQNFALGDLQLAAQVLPKSGELQIHTQLDCLGAGGSRTVELYLEKPDPGRPFLQNGKPLLPEAQLRRQEIVKLPENGSQTLDFYVGNLELGVHQGFVKLVGQDGLPSDNLRYFTVEVQKAMPVLLLAPPGVSAKYLTEALAPYEFRQTGRARYDCVVKTQPDLTNQELKEYGAVCLLDPTPLTPADWEKLAAYVRGGGGLALFLGHNANTVAFNDPSATPLVGGKLTRQWRAADEVFLAPRTFTHPVTEAFRDVATTVPWSRFPVHRHWVLEELIAGTQLLIPFSNNKPALVEAPLGAGRTLTLLTPITDPPRPPGRQAWNELPTGADAWPYVMLVNELVRYLVDTAGTNLNYVVGQTAVLPIRRDQDPERYQLFTPLEQPQDVTASSGKLVVKFTEYPGAYRLRGNRGVPVVRGFAVNVPRAASDLRRLERDELNSILGAERYHYAKTREEIVFGVGEARMGREFYPLLVSLAAVVLALEQLLANRFYRPGD